MEAKHVKDLMEAYASVYVSQEEVEQLDEGRRTSLSALSRESQQRKADKERGRPETESETHGRLMLGKFRPGASKEERAEGGRQRLKDRGKVPQKGGKDMFEHILEHLVAEGYADTNEAAIAIMANMSEEWRQSIVEEVLDEELTGERLERAETKIKSLGRKKSTLSSRESLFKVAYGKEGTGLPSGGQPGGRKAPVKRGGGGTKGQAKVSGSGGDDMDRGYGNKAARRG